uniref:Helicase-primase domain n=1 Tax=Glypta fumiferanae TaxID=389681 RepID=A0A0F6QA58_9HYME|nr:helicase-primase domain [Glypta fumiferanae]
MRTWLEKIMKISISVSAPSKITRHKTIFFLRQLWFVTFLNFVTVIGHVHIACARTYRYPDVKRDDASRDETKRDKKPYIKTWQALLTLKHGRSSIVLSWKMDFICDNNSLYSSSDENNGDVQHELTQQEYDMDIIEQGESEADIVESDVVYSPNTTSFDFRPSGNNEILEKSEERHQMPPSITKVWRDLCRYKPSKYGVYNSEQDYLLDEDSDDSSIDWMESVNGDEKDEFYNPPDMVMFKNEHTLNGGTVNLHNDLYESKFTMYDETLGISANSFIDSMTRKLSNTRTVAENFNKRGEYFNFSTPKQLYRSRTSISQGYTFNVSKRRFVPHSFHTLCTAQANIDPLSVMPRADNDTGKDSRKLMLRVMRQIFPDREVFEYTMDVLMQLLISGNHSRMLIVCWGKQRNGKSLFINIITKMFEGKRMLIHIPKKLLYRRGESEKDSTTKECLGEDRVAIINELSWADVTPIGYSAMKSWVGSDVNANRGPYGMDNNNATFNAVPFIVSNGKPSYLPNETALADRIRILPFQSTFLEGNDYREYQRSNVTCTGKTFEADPTLLDKQNVGRIANALMLYICGRLRFLRMTTSEIKSIRFSAVPQICAKLKHDMENQADPLFTFSVRRLHKTEGINVSILAVAQAFDAFINCNYGKGDRLASIQTCYPMGNVIQILSIPGNVFTEAQFEDLADEYMFIKRLQTICRSIELKFDLTYTNILNCSMI